MNEKTKQPIVQAYCILLLIILFCSGRAAAQADYTPMTVQNGGAIAGTVTWTGPIPKSPSCLSPKTRTSAIRRA